MKKVVFCIAMILIVLFAIPACVFVVPIILIWETANWIIKKLEE